jgi:hypothetical protein
LYISLVVIRGNGMGRRYKLVPVLGAHHILPEIHEVYKLSCIVVNFGGMRDRRYFELG